MSKHFTRSSGFIGSSKNTGMSKLQAAEYNIHDLPTLRRKRTLAYNRMSKALDIGTKAESDESQLNLFLSYCTELDAIANDFEKTNLIVLELLNTPDDQDDNDQQTFDDMYFKAKSLYQTLKRPDDLHLSTQNAISESSKPTLCHVKLPKIPLPTFSGQVKEWPEFFDSFDNLINKCSILSDTEKFHYLVSSLSGDALALIRTFPVTSDHYIDAYQALISRYQDKRDLAFSCWRDILNVSFKLNDVRAFRRALDSVDENLSILRKLNLPVDSWNFILSYHILSKLDPKTRRDFEEKYSNIEIPDYKQLTAFLHSKCEALIRDTHFTDVTKVAATNKYPTKQATANSSKRPNVTHTLIVSEELDNHISPMSEIPDMDTLEITEDFRAHTNTLVASGKPAKVLPPSKNYYSNTAYKCPFCGESHSITQCKLFAQKSIAERMDIASEMNWCFNCLKASHQLKACNSIFTCQKCKRKHHTLLHNDNKNSESQSNPYVASNSVSLVAKESSNTTVLLATAIVQIRDESGSFHSLRALFDTGSQNNFITETALKKLNLQPTASHTNVNGLGGTAAMITGCVQGAIGVNDTVLFDLEMHVIDKICGDQPIAKLNTTGWSHIQSLQLADAGFDIPGPIDILLNADVFAESLLNERIKGNSTQPPAFNSVFGWLLLGKVPLSSTSLLHTQSNANIDNLTDIVQRFWEIDNVPRMSILTPDELLCEQKFTSEHYRDDTGRYVVRLPFKDNQEQCFKGSRDVALRRFHAIERRLSKDLELQRQYTEFMADYLENGHMSRVPVNEVGSGKYYIPHHCILRPDSATTKLRVVYDASANDINGKSLNETLLSGPKLQSNIVEILLRFREHAVVIMADVRQMYRQILVTNEDRDYQRILWRARNDEPLQEYQLNTVTYGVASAPFLACRTVQQLANDEGDKYPLAKQVLTSDIYVDDVVTGSDSIETAQETKTQLIGLFQSGKFELRKWASNKPELLADLPPEHCLVETKSFDDAEPTTLKVLGLKWDPKTDSFLFNVQPSNQTCTKRSILSELARIFDPLGFLAPVTIQAKCLIQRLWIIGVTWDEIPPEEITRFWNTYLQQLLLLKSFQIARRITLDVPLSYELHGFCDSSEAAYGAVIYLRALDKDNCVQTFFVCSKARVAPTKRVSLPRLELCAAVLLADLVKFVKTAYLDRISIEATHLWSDSTVVLSWLRSHSSRWVTYVANRVGHIQELTPTASWHHVPSADNPADICSRGQLAGDLLDNSLWWAGPSFLTQSADQWPSLNSTINETEIVRSEERHTSTLISEETKGINSAAVVSTHSILDELLIRHSSLDKVVRIVAYVQRFIHNIRKSNLRRHDSFLTSIERQNALMILVKHVQNMSFREEIAKLQSAQQLPKHLRKLNPFLDENGILRVGGRISRSGLEFSQRHPALLPGHDILTHKIIESIHRKHCHTGINTTHYLIVQQFWILSAKRIIRRCLSKCIRCYRTRPQTLEPFMSDLPSYRVNQVKPFSIVGVDFGGPFRIKFGSHRGAKIDKAYLCLFVCLATKTVHLEVVSTLSTEGFIAALRRFISRRGRCNEIHADCGTNFVGASRHLFTLMKNASQSEQINFKFNPPSAPHFGGVWEIQIKAAKSHLYRVVGDQVLSFEELTTLFAQIEAVLNSRPLCPLSSDPNDMTALTPGHFLTLEPLTAVPDTDHSGVRLNRLNRWQLIQSFHQNFWVRWKTEYLHSLTQRAKWTKASKPLQVNDMVILKDDNRAPLHWSLGRVTALHPGPDGIVRLATVRTANHNLIKRPLVKLCPLPLN